MSAAVESTRAERVALDVGDLPIHGKDTASLTWWGTLGFMLLEGSGFALAIAVYLYLMSLAPEWPLSAPPPDLTPGLLVTAILLASVVPNVLVARWARKEDLYRTRIGIVVMSVVGALPLLVRAYEFRSINVSWDSNAYGSIVWLLLGLHTTHLLTDLADTLVLAVIMWTRHGPNPRRFGDVQDNALYWNFVVATWIPIAICLYAVPRL